MSDRLSRYKPLDRCFNPITVHHGDRSFVVPCGKCSACRLAKANDWSYRVAYEINASVASLWFTLTYDNKYVPKLKFVEDGLLGSHLTWFHEDNIRFDSVQDVRRFEPELSDFKHFYYPSSSPRYPLERLQDNRFIGYLSKRDIQLFIKNVRKKLREKFGDSLSESVYSLRYYVIGEYGPGTLRPHYHCLFFFNSKEIAEYTAKNIIYSCWKMCRFELYNDYWRLASDGVRNYVTEYVTSFTKLPSLLREKSIRPFRLASKAPSIGYRQFDCSEVFEMLLNGDIEYSLSVSRIDSKYIFRYPKSYINRLFPKCFEYHEKSYYELLFVYGLLWHHVVNKGVNYEGILNRLREILNPADYFSTVTCFNFCVKYQVPPSVYLFFLDLVYYQYDIRQLNDWYAWQEKQAANGSLLNCLASYNNFAHLIRSYSLGSDYCQYVIDLFLKGFNIDYFYAYENLDHLVKLDSEQRYAYVQDVEYIVSRMDKSKKVKEAARNSASCF